MSDKPYKPIACADYDVYEIAIMQNKQLDLCWVSDSAEMKNERVEPLQLLIIDAAEYLMFNLNDQSCHRVRLDKINKAVIV